jgi:hypothetical protein
MQPVMGQQCECEGCRNCNRNDAGRCFNLHGQKELFTGNVIELYQLGTKFCCETCLPKPVVEPANLDPKVFNREKERLERQETLFYFR